MIFQASLALNTGDRELRQNILLRQLLHHKSQRKLTRRNKSVFLVVKLHTLELETLKTYVYLKY